MYDIVNKTRLLRLKLSKKVISSKFHIFLWQKLNDNKYKFYSLVHYLKVIDPKN